MTRPDSESGHEPAARVAHDTETPLPGGLLPRRSQFGLAAACSKAAESSHSQGHRANVHETFAELAKEAYFERQHNRTLIEPGHSCSDQVEQRRGIDSKPDQQNRECDEDENTTPGNYRHRSGPLGWG